MTLQAIKKTVKFLFFIIIVFSCKNIFADHAIEEEEIESSCQLENLPIIKSSSCLDFMDADHRLNRSYKFLKEKLSTSNVVTLKYSQKEWIKFRDSTCQSLMNSTEEKCEENNIYCGSRIPANIHDSCIKNLTLRRADELEMFSTNLETAKSIGYKFSKETFFPDK